jgi:hypothetical protein
MASCLLGLELKKLNKLTDIKVPLMFGFNDIYNKMSEFSLVSLLTIALKSMDIGAWH